MLAQKIIIIINPTAYAPYPVVRFITVILLVVILLASLFFPHHLCSISFQCPY